MQRRNILIDVDNTLTTIDYTLRRLESFCGVLKKEVDEIYSFDLKSVYGVSNGRILEFWETCESEIVKHSDLNEEVLKHIEAQLKQTDYVCIVTARGPEHYEETESWLRAHNIAYDELHCIGKEKNKLEWAKENNRTFDVVVEDNPSYLEILPEDVRKVIVDYPYNRHIKADVRL